jgi:tRNA pseudouridine55 synthase
MRDGILQPDSERSPSSRTGELGGILVFNKPQGMTSHDAVGFVRGLTGVRRVGHTGTLDPMAEGVLPVCVGKATRLIEFMDDFPGASRDPRSKAYDCEMRLGVTTDTLDIWGSAVPRGEAEASGFSHPIITPQRVREVFASFIGDVAQIPPAYSAIKYGGKKLYEYARAGKDIPAEAMSPRVIRIQSIDVTGVAVDADDPGLSAERSHELRLADPGASDIYDRGFATVRFSVVCSKGTYVRSLVRDAGDALGCGAAMSALTRTKSGVFTLADAHTKDELARAAECGDLRDMMLAADAAIPFMPAVGLDASASAKFANGMAVRADGAGARSDASVSDAARADASPGGGVSHSDASRENAAERPGRYVRVYDGERFLGVGVRDGGMIKPRKVLQA